MRLYLGWNRKAVGRREHLEQCRNQRSTLPSVVSAPRAAQLASRCGSRKRSEHESEIDRGALGTARWLSDDLKRLLSPFRCSVGMVPRKTNSCR